jgi:hypothetical protein
MIYPPNMPPKMVPYPQATLSLPFYCYYTHTGRSHSGWCSDACCSY